MNKRIIIAVVLTLVFIAVLFLLIINAWYPIPEVKETCNKTIIGNLRFIEELDRNRVIGVSSILRDNPPLSNIYLIGPPCKLVLLASNHSGVVTGTAFFESYDASFLAVSSYSVGAGGTVGDITVYDLNDTSITRSLRGIKLRNITLTSTTEPGFIYAGIDSSGNIVVAKVSLVYDGFNYEWNRSFRAIMPPQYNNILLSYSDVTGSVVVGAGRTLIVLNSSNGNVLLGLQDIGGVVEKILWSWDRYIVLVDDVENKRVLMLYRDDVGLWNYTTIYSSNNIVDVYPIIEAKAVAVAEGPSLIEAYARNNTSSTILLVGYDGDVKSRVKIGDAIIGLRGYVCGECRYGPYVLVDYVLVNGSKTVYYTSLVSLSRNTSAWKYYSFRPLRSHLSVSNIYVAVYDDNKTELHYYTVTLASS